METFLSPRWSFVLLRALASVAFGVVALAMPRVTLSLLAFLFGAYALADGVITLVAAARRGRTPHRWLLVVDGLALCVGAATLFWPELTLTTLVLLVGVRFLIAGAFQIAASYALSPELDAPGAYRVGGLASIVVGVTPYLASGASARMLSILLGAYALVFGVVMATIAFDLRRTWRILTHP
ncbi:MAG: DUF308 domain-containing protein [Deltaproteobacteria bacterium]|nr:DUF308 domain-containing protein [Deltaproteobacteria bacterium]